MLYNRQVRCLSILRGQVTKSGTKYVSRVTECEKVFTLILQLSFKTFGQVHDQNVLHTARRSHRCSFLGRNIGGVKLRLN